MQTILTQSVGGSGTSSIPGEFNTGTVVPFAIGTNVINVDVIPIVSGMLSVKWIYTLASTNSDAILSAEVVAVYRNGVVTHHRHSVIGDRSELKHTHDVKVIGSDVVLEIANVTDSLLTETDFTTTIIRIQSL